MGGKDAAGTGGTGSTGSTPLRRQYLALKKRYPDAILFFRLGDFYETFDGDAELTARVLQITLTSREMGKGQRVPMAGVPYHAAEGYIARLIAAGHKVAVCEQLDPAAPSQPAGPAAGSAPAESFGKGMMARQVVRVVTPGTVVEPRMLDARRNNYLCALIAAYGAGGAVRYGLAYADLTTGEFAAAEFTGEEAAAELARELERLRPAECLVPAARPPGPGAGTGLGQGSPGSVSGQGDGAPALEEAAAAGRNVTGVDAWRFELGTAQEALCRLFGVTSLAGFGCAHLPLATQAAGALVAYVEQTHRPLLALLDGLRTYEPGGYMRLDGFTRRSLDLVDGGGHGGGVGAPRPPDGNPRPSLLSVVDDTRTPMGGRLLRRWIGQPLLDLDALRARHDVVDALASDGVLRGRLRAVIGRVADVERLTNRARQGTAQPRDLLALRASLLAAAELAEVAEVAAPSPAAPAAQAGAVAALVRLIDPCADVAGLIERAVYDATDGQRKKGAAGALGTWEEERLIRPGYSEELDELVRSSADARQWIAGLEAAERERTGIKGLKVGFNKVFGYYLHVSHAYKGEVPADYIRRQTLTDGERYITPELKEYENLVLHAQERIAELERTLFGEVQRQVAAQARRLLDTAAALAQLDVLAGFAEVAMRRGYVRPEVDDGQTIDIRDGRHPVVEAALEAATAQMGQPAAFVPNDCRLSAADEQIVVLTGPNMAGKSTYLRAVALIVLLAQAGSFVPAAAARIGLVDRIFTRVGAQDDLAAGQSTFMVEMLETASILRHATPRSLVVLDEIGRGTSTYDGVAIAQAVVEHLHGQGGPDAPGASGPRTLFATHYHELAELAQTLPRVRNHRMDVLEEGDRVVFLHRVVAGSAGRSYGIHVARLAGVPRSVTRRAEEVLAELERRRPGAVFLPGGAGGGAERGSSRGPADPARGDVTAVPGQAPAAGPASVRGADRRPEAGPAGAQRNDHTAGSTDAGAGAARRGGRSARPNGHAAGGEAGRNRAGVLQMPLFAPVEQTHPLVEELKALDVLNLTPLAALNRLADLVRRAQEE